MTTLLEPKELTDIVNKNNDIKGKLDKRLYLTLPRLVDYVRKLTKNSISANISNSYPYETKDNKVFTHSYTILEGDIYRMVLDPDADIMDPEDSFMEKISKREFMKWVKQDNSRALDVYNHIVEYMKLLPKLKKFCNDEGYLEIMMRYP